MKKFFYLSVVCLLNAASTQAQGKLELSALAGYTFGSTVNFSSGSGHVNDGMQWFGSLETPIAPNLNIGLLYSHMGSDVTVYQYEYQATRGISFDYINGVITKYVLVGEKLRPYFGVELGCVIMTPEDEEYSTTVRAAFGLKLGAQYMITNTVGFKLQTQLLTPIHASGATYYYGYGGSGVSVSSYVSVYHFGFSGGLVFAFGKANAAPAPE